MNLETWKSEASYHTVNLLGTLNLISPFLGNGNVDIGSVGVRNVIQKSRDKLRFTTLHGK